MKCKYLILAGIILAFTQCKNGKQNQESNDKSITMSKAKLQDKIMGGWAGQTIGVTYGGPVEFRFKGTMMQDYQPIPWYDGYVKWWYQNAPGLYDDIYMDLTFVEVFERCGLDAPVDSFASAFANASYDLWHANQAGRYNYLNGIKPPFSGHWLNNPHADCIDYQIEADYSGLMSPAMPNTASQISDKIGHIMNFGDGWYGGVYVGAMYSLAFASDDINYIVNEALKTIPAESDFYKCISDVIAWQKKYPNDWKQTWFEVQKKWSDDKGCPEGVFDAFDIDATVNSAYVVIGLLYGNKDIQKTLDIATRCGQDADCNPSTAGGILGTMLGYSKIPDYWLKNIKEVEDMNFKYTTISLNKVYALSEKHAIENIKRNGGEVSDTSVTILFQEPKAVKFEKSFDGIMPVKRIDIEKNMEKSIAFDFEGTGFVIRGEVTKIEKDAKDKDVMVELWIDGKKTETAKLPTAFKTRRYELFWNYQLPMQKHAVEIKWADPKDAADANINVSNVIVYSGTAKVN